MSYFVIHENGQKYGPADLNALNIWVLEGRIGPETLIEDDETGVQMAAKMVAGINLNVIHPLQTEQQMTGYHRESSPIPAPDKGQSELMAAWIFGGLTGAVCCPGIAIIGLIMANRALKQGSTSAKAARIFNIVMIVLSTIGLAGNIFMSQFMQNMIMQIR